MAVDVRSLPTRRLDLVFCPRANGRWVVKDPRNGNIYEFGPQERFLLDQLDGSRTPETICQNFTDQFHEPLPLNDLAGFISMADGRGLLQHGNRVRAALAAPAEYAEPLSDQVVAPAVRPSAAPAPEPSAVPPRSRGSILYWRHRLIDPDRLLTALAPLLWFFWTPAFGILSVGTILLAGSTLALNWWEFASYFTDALSWKTVVLAWCVVFGVTVLHELAHGLTCKHYGGEVHEIGLLLLLFMPGLYCNVSDAWLMSEKRKRLLITLAGGYFELFLWSLAVLTWRVTVVDGVLNYLAWFVVSISGVRVLFNFNPLLKLDGYYLLSDALEIPNLRQKSIDYAVTHLRWLAGLTDRPASRRQGALLILFGAASAAFSLTVLGLMVYAVLQMWGTFWGPAAIVGVLIVGLVGFRPLRAPAQTAPATARPSVWLRRGYRLGGLALVCGAVLAIPVTDRVGGTFQLRPVTRQEVRTRTAGYLNEINVDEGQSLKPSSRVARLMVPDLETRLRQKGAEVRECEAKLRLLKAGTRPEEIREQVGRVERARSRWQLSQRELVQSKEAYVAAMTRVNQQITQQQATGEFAEDQLKRFKRLEAGGNLSPQEMERAVAQYRIAKAQLAQAISERDQYLAAGVLAAEASLDRYAGELAEARAALHLMEAGTRPEEIEAEQARLARLHEELTFLTNRQRELEVRVGDLPGIVITPRLKDRLGEYLAEGALVCEIQDNSRMEAAIALKEQDAARLQVGDLIRLKARSLPRETFEARVERIAPAAATKDEHQQSTVAVYCHIANEQGDLRSDMTGYAYVYRDRRPLGSIALERGMNLLRTEFWW